MHTFVEHQKLEDLARFHSAGFFLNALFRFLFERMPGKVYLFDSLFRKNHFEIHNSMYISASALAFSPTMDWSILREKNHALGFQPGIMRYCQFPIKIQHFPVKSDKIQSRICRTRKAELDSKDFVVSNRKPYQKSRIR